MDYHDHGFDLVRFADWRPTAFDARGLGSDGQEDWRVLPVMRTRDSGPRADSNFESAIRILDSAGAEYAEVRLGHWGPGWVEIVVVRPDDIGLATAGRIACELADYPILDEDDLSAREVDAVADAWRYWQERDVLDWISRVSERVGDIAEDAPDAVWAWASDLSRGYDYDGDSPSIDIRRDDITRDAVARLARKIRSER
jgi:hypothetical protein